jgi:hypothetical protein
VKALVQEKERAIEMRKKGYSYKEIMAEVKVAKSSLSLWLKDLPLTEYEKKALKQRRHSNISRGRIKLAGILRSRRLAKEAVWLNEAKVTFQNFKSDPFFHTGIALYWAEGTKRCNQLLFINSDPEMIECIVCWLETFLGYSRQELRYRLFIHKPYAHENLERFWMSVLGTSAAQQTKTIYKPTNYGVKKRPNYKGCLRIEVPKSKELLCKMKFWQSMQVEYWRKR